MEYFKPSRPVPIVQYSWSFSEVEFRYKLWSDESWGQKSGISLSFHCRRLPQTLQYRLKADGISCFEEAIGDLERGRATTCPGWNVLWTIKLFSKIHNVGEVVQKIPQQWNCSLSFLFFPWCLHLSSSKKGWKSLQWIKILKFLKWQFSDPLCPLSLSVWHPFSHLSKWLEQMSVHKKTPLK